MNILYVTATYYPAVNGVAISLKSFRDELIKHGHKVVVVAPEQNGYKDDDINIIRYPSLPNPINKDYPLPVLPLHQKLLTTLNKEKFDIVHAQHPFHIAWFAQKFAKLNKSPLVFTFHTKYEDYVDTYLKFLPKGWGAKIVKNSTEYICNNADLVITPSMAIKNLLQNEYPKTNIKVVPTGVAFETKPDKNKDELRKKWGIPLNKKVLLSLSRVAAEKNIELLIHTMTNLPTDYILVIVGGGPHETILKQLANDLKVNERILFLGKINHAEVPEAIMAADMFLFPSITETQGLNLLEAMYFGLPVVAVESDVGKEWIPKDVGVLTANNAADFTQGIINVAGNPAKFAGKRATDWAKNFTIEKTSEKLLEAYNEIIKTKTNKAI